MVDNEGFRYDYVVRGESGNAYLPHMRHFAILNEPGFENENLSDLSSNESLDYQR